MVRKIQDISSLSFIESALLIGNYNHVLNGGKEEVNPELATRGYSAEALRILQERLPKVTFESLGLKFTRHLSKFKHPQISYLMRLYSFYERGFLPFDGSITDQPAQIMEIFSIFQAVKYEREKLKQEKYEANVRSQHQDKNRASR